MATLKMIYRAVRPSTVFTRPISTSMRRMAGPGNVKSHEGTEEHRNIQSEKPLNPHVTNTNSTIANDMPSVGVNNAPPELISSVDPKFTTKDSYPENTERMTGGTQNTKADGSAPELGVGEMSGAQFKVEPLRRTGEDANTMRARLLYQCRKRGILESDLLMSTFAQAHLMAMTPAQMTQFDLFLDENDWDIYYWATQEPAPSPQETAEGAGALPEGAAPSKQGTDVNPVMKGTGEWAQTVGTFKPAYRPVPSRWRNSEILAMLRRHVVSRSAGGVFEGSPDGSREALNQSVNGTGGGGMAFMPPVFQTDRP